MTNKELEQMAQALTDGTLSESEFDQLQDELRSNTDSRAFFRRSMEVEMLLIEAVGQHASFNNTIGHTKECLHRRRRRDFFRGLLATAAILTLVGIVMALMTIQQGDPPALISTAVPGTQWQVTDQEHSSEKNTRKVIEGSTVRVLSGSVKLEFESGMVMLIRGPAEATFPKLDRPVLHHGWLWVDSGGSASSIIMDTPHSRVRNIGTRFGVRVNKENDSTEIHLLDGRLEVISKHQERKPMTMEPTDKGISLSSSGPSSELPLAADPFPGLPELLKAAPDYRTTLLSQGPAGYWRFDDKQDEQELTNEIPQGTVGRRLINNSRLDPGIGKADGFHGFPADNQSVFLTGDRLESVLMNLDLPGGVSREEGGVSFWIRRAAGAGRGEILWLAGESAHDSMSSPRESLMHTRLSDTGRVEFFIENGDFDILLTSNFSVADDRWHHIATSWGPSAVELYVNGRRVARADDFGDLRQGIVHGRHVRFGKPSRDLELKGWAPFTGWVDELALWNRPLSSEEIDHQFQAARGMAR